MLLRATVKAIYFSRLLGLCEVSVCNEAGRRKQEEEMFQNAESYIWLIHIWYKQDL